MAFHNWLLTHLVMEVVGTECVVGVIGVEFVVVQVSINVHVLTKSASSVETRSLHHR